MISITKSDHWLFGMNAADHNHKKFNVNKSLCISGINEVLIFRMNDVHYMKLALKLAAKGQGYASPNPMVGAVLVKQNRIIGQGYHRCCGENHAEVNAIENATEDVEGSTLYVTLEPCCHHGRTPPCTDRIIQHKIARVVIGSVDSNPQVACRGIRTLQQSGIEVESGVLEREYRAFNEVFFHYMETGLPFVTIKYAQTLDGRIATAEGQSQWISSPPSLKFVHRLRARHDAILVGVGTVLQDDPELTVRLVRGRNPIRIVVDSHLKIPESAKLLRTASQTQTIIATTQNSTAPRAKLLAEMGAHILRIDADAQGRVNLKKLLEAMASRNVSSVLVEGGSQIITSFLKHNLANRLIAVIAPKILGRGTDAVGDLQISDLGAARKLTFQKVSRLGEDIIIDSRLAQPRQKTAGGPDAIDS